MGASDSFLSHARSRVHFVAIGDVLPGWRYTGLAQLCWSDKARKGLELEGPYFELSQTIKSRIGNSLQWDTWGKAGIYLRLTRLASPRGKHNVSSSSVHCTFSGAALLVRESGRGHVLERRRPLTMGPQGDICSAGKGRGGRVG